MTSGSRALSMLLLWASTTLILHIPNEYGTLSSRPPTISPSKTGVIRTTGDSNIMVYMSIQEDITLYAHYTVLVG